MNGDGRSEIHVLEGEEEAEEGERAEGAARDEEGVVIALPGELPARDLDPADDPGAEATEEDDLHRRDAIELFHEDVHGREGESGDEHVCDAAIESARAGRSAGRRMHGGSWRESRKGKVGSRRLK